MVLRKWAVPSVSSDERETVTKATEREVKKQWNALVVLLCFVWWWDPYRDLEWKVSLTTGYLVAVSLVPWNVIKFQIELKWKWKDFFYIHHCPDFTIVVCKIKPLPSFFIGINSLHKKIASYYKITWMLESQARLGHCSKEYYICIYSKNH